MIVSIIERNAEKYDNRLDYLSMVNPNEKPRPPYKKRRYGVVCSSSEGDYYRWFTSLSSSEECASQIKLREKNVRICYRDNKEKIIILSKVL